MSREAMQMALEALESDPISHVGLVSRKQAITALRQALETEQEPFEYWNAVGGWVKIDEVREHFDAVGCGTIYKSAGEGRSPLYTAPPKQWVGLTDEEIQDLGYLSEKFDASNSEWFDRWGFARAIEAKLKVKNGGEYRNGATTERTKLNQENT
jgi:hypothetical protein